MTHTLCLTGLRHDLRLTRQLNAFELRHFLLTLDFAGGLRDRTFIPAKKREELRLTLGFGSSDQAREKMDKRLRRYHDLELLRLYDDGSLLLTYLLDQDAEEDNLLSYPVSDTAYPISDPVRSAGNGSAHGSANGSANGAGGERRSSPERRQPGRILSQNPEAVRKRNEYWATKDAENGITALGAGVAAPETPGENLRVFASKPPAMSGEFASDGTQNLRLETSENLPSEAEVSHTGVGSNSNLESGEREFINYSSSGIEFEFEAEKNLQAETSGEAMKTSGERPPAPTDSPAGLSHSPAASSPPRPEPPNFNEPPALAAEMVKVKRAEAVKAVLALTSDPPVNRHLWLKYWDICHLSGNLPAWDEAQDRLRKAVMERSEGIGVRAAWLTTALRRLLEESDRQVFIPTKAQIAENSQEDIRALLAQSFPPADGAAPEPVVAAPAPVVAAPAPNVYQRSQGRITPLEDRSAELDALPDYSEEEP